MGGGGGTWKGLVGSLPETCLWPPGNMMGGAGGRPPRTSRSAAWKEVGNGDGDGDGVWAELAVEARGRELNELEETGNSRREVTAANGDRGLEPRGRETLGVDLERGDEDDEDETSRKRWLRL